MSEYLHEVAKAANLVASADGLMITAGAGMSVDSGLPDYRGDKGFWQNYAGIGEAEVPYERLSSSVAFEQIPELAWGFFGHQLLMYRKAAPHKGYQLLREIGEQKKHGLFVITSNIDGHFIKAKFDRSRIYEVHGSIHHLQCVENCTEAIWDTDEFDPEVDMVHCRLLSPLPLCPECGSMARPNVAMSSDWGWNDVFAELQKKRFQQWRNRCENPVVIEIGAGCIFQGIVDGVSG